jgi:enamine deaminase RidA (YjgF/YER057c/UK114 family)
MGWQKENRGVAVGFIVARRPGGGHITFCHVTRDAMRPLNPSTIAPPLARYAHGVQLPAGARIIRTSGQLGIAADGTVPESVADQAAICFGNIRVILAEGGMGVDDICHISAWLTDRAYLASYMVERDAFLTGCRVVPASTLLLVAGFSRPEFKVEIEMMAASISSV